MPNVTAGFALETQTRPFYGPGTFRSGANVSVVVHELAHQWYGDSVSVEGWKDIWINEGFARYSQWLWSEKEGEGTARELADWAYALRPAEDAFWQVKPGDPGPDNQFHGAVYDRGAIALQALRNEIGDERFFEILKGWPTERAYGNARVGDFVRYAEKVSKKPLAQLFETWLYTPGKPDASALNPAAAKPSARSQQSAPAKPAAEPKSWKKIAETNTIHTHGKH